MMNGLCPDAEVAARTHSISSARSAPYRHLASHHNAADPREQQNDGQVMPIDKLIAIGLPIALGVVMIGAGLVNFVGPGSVRDSFARWGYPAGFHRVTGGLEVTAELLLLIQVLRVPEPLGAS